MRFGVSLFRRDRIGLGITSGHLVCASSHAVAPAAIPFEFEPGSLPIETMSQGLRDSLRAALEVASRPSTGKRRPFVRAVVSSDIARHWMVEPPSVSSLHELRLVVSARFTQVYGGSAAAWSIAADWRMGRAFMCTALPRWLTEGIESVCEDMGLRHDVSTTLGQILNLYGEHIPSDGWSCVRTPGSLFVLRLHAGLPASLRVVLRAGSDNPTAALHDGISELRRESIRAGQEVSGPVTWLNLTCQSDDQRSTEREVDGLHLRVLHFGGEADGRPQWAPSEEGALAASLAFEYRRARQ